jgi:chemotaxis response regulator CheB
MTIAQAEDSCVVYGMPRAAIERGLALRIVALENLATSLQALCLPDRKQVMATAVGHKSGTQ